MDLSLNLPSHGKCQIHSLAQLQERMQRELPEGWEVETVPLTVGVRGS
jgi:hypothetical protein